MINTLVSNFLKEASIVLPEGVQTVSLSGNSVFSLSEKFSLSGDLVLTFNKSFTLEAEDGTKIKLASTVKAKLIDNGLSDIQGVNVDLLGPLDPAIKKIVYNSETSEIEVSGLGFKQVIPCKP